MSGDVHANRKSVHVHWHVTTLAPKQPANVIVRDSPNELLGPAAARKGRYQALCPMVRIKSVSSRPQAAKGAAAEPRGNSPTSTP